MCVCVCVCVLEMMRNGEQMLNEVLCICLQLVGFWVYIIVFVDPVVIIL